MWQKSYDDKPTLYLVPTPIGNLDDITLRALKVLQEVVAIFSEDTRVTGLLLNHFEIKKKLISLHEHNEEEKKNVVLEYLNNGKSVALVTDRGTPIISDPGYKTVKYVIDNNYNVVALPGACAFVPALISSGLNPQPFLFYGFLNSKKSKREEELNRLKYVTDTIIFYEAPHRIKDTLNSILNIFGNRQICLSREITKKFESIYRGFIDEIIFGENDLKGEFVIVVAGATETNTNLELDLNDQIDLYIETGMNVMDAIKKVAKERNIVKSEVYKQYHRRKK